MRTRIMALGLLLLLLVIAPTLVMLMLGVGFWWPLAIFTAGLGMTIGSAYVARLAGFERVMRHVAGIGCICLTGGLVFLAYHHDHNGEAFLMLLLAVPFGYSAWGYVSGRRGVPAAESYRGYLIQPDGNFFNVVWKDGRTIVTTESQQMAKQAIDEIEAAEDTDTPREEL